MSCKCGNIALALIEDDELCLRYIRCLACGANLLLRFTDTDRKTLILENGK